MRLMRPRPLAGRFLVLLSVLLCARDASSTDFVVYPVKVTLPVSILETSPGGDSIAKKTLKEKDLVNLALGRALGTKVDKNTEILALQAARYSNDAGEGRLVVFDPSENGMAQVTAVVAQPTSLDFDVAWIENGRRAHGFVEGTFVETTLGDPSKYAIHATDVWIGGGGKGVGEKKPKGKLVIAGRMSFTNTEDGVTTTYAGFIGKAKAVIAGEPIGMFSDGPAGFCGDGVVQPELGEECEFLDQSACPGSCAACECRVCGNDRRDLGEICDGTDDDVCDGLSNNTGGCRPDCSGCYTCGDLEVGPNEECDLLGNQCGGGRCLQPSCVCGCDPGANDCPSPTCCDVSTGLCCQPRVFASDPACGLVMSTCNGGTPLFDLCGGVVPAGQPCPDQDGDANTFFACHSCQATPLTADCTFNPEACLF